MTRPMTLRQIKDIERVERIGRIFQIEQRRRKAEAAHDGLTWKDWAALAVALVWMCVLAVWWSASP